MSEREDLEELLSKLSFLKEYTVSKPVDVISEGIKGKYIDVIVLRKIVGPVIFRNTERVELTYTDLNGKVVVEVYSRKFKAPEKITGLKILKKYNVLPKDYSYNALTHSNQLKNPVSVLYGDSVTAGENEQGAQIPSRVLYSWAISPQELECVSEERVHNALSEMGTMWDIKAQKFKQSLFKNIYMKKGHLIQIISFYNVSIPEFVFGIGNILFTKTYGGEDNVNIRNIENRIVSVVFSTPFEPSISPYEISSRLVNEKDCEELLNDNTIEEEIKNYVNEKLKNSGYAKIVKNEEKDTIISVVASIYNDPDVLKQLIEILKSNSEEFVIKLLG